MRFLASEVAAAVGGELVGADVEITSVTIDSRDVRGGALFVPIVAARDGHDFIETATEQGAVAHLTSRPASEAGGPTIEVPDTAAALLDLGRAARTRLPNRVVGVTGSVGKTTVKDLLKAILSRRFITAASEQSFNNELGVPITLVNAPQGAEAAVIEMGARGPGHIHLLCSVARPTVGVVTVVADAHLEMFGSMDGVARAKGELVEALPAEGTAVLNADDQRVLAMAARAEAAVLTFGVRGGDVRAESIQMGDDLRPSFRLCSPEGTIEVLLGIRGRHNVTNALAAAAAALALGCTLDELAQGLAHTELSAMRMDVVHTRAGATVINDAYNANPTSMRAALEALAALPAERHTAVLGPMAELGPDSDRLHREVCEHARKLGIEVVAVGAPAYGARSVADVAGALVAVGPLDPSHAVLVKASRVAQLEQVVASLLAG